MLHNSASIGATLFDGLTASSEDLLNQADLAMYQAKAAGRNALRFFGPELETNPRSFDPPKNEEWVI
jgi:predicted signal transduction protein with EAL and GGDEF domain